MKKAVMLILCAVVLASAFGCGKKTPLVPPAAAGTINNPAQ